MISALFATAQRNYTSPEELLNQLAYAYNTGNVEKRIQLYNTMMNVDVEVSTVLEQIARDYTQYQNYLEGGMVVYRYYNRESVEQDSKNLYIFTDNTDRDSGSTEISQNSWYYKVYGNGEKPLHYPSVSTAQIRGLDNAFPISTQRWYNDKYKGSTGHWNDEDLETLKDVVEKELDMIQQAWSSGAYNNIILPKGSFFNSPRSEITKERCPKIYEYFEQVEQRIKDFVDGNPLSEIRPQGYNPGERISSQIMSARPASSSDALQFLIQNGKNEDVVRVARILQNYASNHSVEIQYVNAKDEFKAHYVGNSDKIEVNLDSDDVYINDEEIFLHEILHSLTSQWLRDHKDASDKIMQIADYVKPQLKKFSRQHAFDNAREFLTYAMTNQEFKEELKSIPPMSEGEYSNILSEFFSFVLNIIRSIMGKPSASVYDQISPIIVRVMELQSFESKISEIQDIDEYENSIIKSLEQSRKKLGCIF